MKPSRADKKWIADNAANWKPNPFRQKLQGTDPTLAETLRTCYEILNRQCPITREDFGRIYKAKGLDFVLGLVEENKTIDSH